MVSPFCRPGSVLVGGHDGGVDLSVPINIVVELSQHHDLAFNLAQVPSAAHLPNRRYRVFHGPYRSGRSRHGEPVRLTQQIALITCGWSRHRRPWTGCADNNSASTAHSSLLWLERESRTR